MTKNNQKTRSRRERLFKKSPFCYWCGQRLVEDTSKYVPPNAATIDHRHGRLDPRRRVDYGVANRSVLACRQCNQDRARADEKNVGIEELWRRANRSPIEVGT